MHQPVDPTPCDDHLSFSDERFRARVRAVLKDFTCQKCRLQYEPLEDLLAYSRPFMVTPAARGYWLAARTALNNLQGPK